MKDVKVFLSEKEIKEKVAELGKQISEDYRGSDKNLLVISILKGSVIFLSCKITHYISIEHLLTKSQYTNQMVSNVENKEDKNDRK